MSQSSSDRLISRINALHKSLQLDAGGKLSAMERDLMLGYLRELYELYATHGEAPAKVVAAPPSAPPPAPTPPPAPAPAPPPPPVVEVPKPTPPPPPPPAPVVETPKPAPPPPPPASAPTPAPAINTSLSSDLRDLFSEDDLASPFGRQPLADLTRSLTINNRVLFSKDLFGDDNDLLNTTLRTLNSSGSMAAAQPVMVSLARRFEWADESKKETAREFIELVRRRYA
ncbi:hypothetical protein [Neolewinella persica]|uniref:hypothetical protein n=1 Tax=Neolewinella persica TaxID=70998 RepID=UPI0003A8011A|nr:hypothetical protein [Neolewinella persica]